MVSRKNKKNRESKLLYVPFGVLGVVLLLIILPGIIGMSPKSNTNGIPLGEFVKVSNQDYSTDPGTVQVYFVSWYGCPVGASLSWPLYEVMSHYGHISYQLNYSTPLEKDAPNLPTMIFKNFSRSSNVEFIPVYLYGRFLNTTPSGQPIQQSQLIQVGESELEKEVPQPIYNIIVNYTTEVDLLEQTHNGTSVLPPSAYDGNPQKINSVIVITGPNGTYLLNGPLPTLNPPSLRNITTQEMIDVLNTQNYSSLPPNLQNIYLGLQDSASQILSVIQSVE